MIKYIITWILCILIGIIIGIVVRKKFKLSKKVDRIVFFTLSTGPYIMGILLIYIATNIPLCDLRGYTISISGLGLGWILNSWYFEKKQNKK